MTGACIASAGLIALAAWLYSTRPEQPQTTEDTWARVVALHMEQATPERRS